MPEPHSAFRRRVIPVLLVGLLAAAIGAAALLPGQESGRGQREGSDTAAPDEIRRLLPAGLRHLVIHDSAKPVPAHVLTDGAGDGTDLDALAGRLRVVNFWASWCTPCRKEMPALDRLEAELGGDRFAVVAVSLDREGAGKARGFYEEAGIQHLAIWVDPGQKFAAAAGVLGLPATLVVDRTGSEIARLTGPAEWDTPEVIEFFRQLTEAGSG